MHLKFCFFIAFLSVVVLYGIFCNETGTFLYIFLIYLLLYLLIHNFQKHKFPKITFTNLLKHTAELCLAGLVELIPGLLNWLNLWAKERFLFIKNDISCQFDQHLTGSFYAPRSQKHNKDSQFKQLFALLGSVGVKAVGKHVDEIDI